MSMSNHLSDDNYNDKQINDFRLEFIKFLDRYTISPKWYEKQQSNNLYVTGHTLQKFLYNKRDKKTKTTIHYSADIFHFKGMKPNSFYGLLDSIKSDKVQELAADKAAITELYKRWREAKLRYLQNLNQDEDSEDDSEIEGETDLALEEGVDSEQPAPIQTIPPSPTKIMDKKVIAPPQPIKQATWRQRLTATLSRQQSFLILFTLIGLLGASVLYSQSSKPPTIITENSQWTPIYQTFEGIRTVYVPEGCFTMGYLHGEPSEQPVQRICLEPFWMAETETTIEQYGETPLRDCNLDQITLEKLVNEPTPTSPMNCVTWEEAHDFCSARGMRLPTEAEWEYAARGPSNWLYPWGNEAEATYTIVRIDPNAPRPVLPVGSISQDTSWVGAKDMAGNVREFTSTIHNISMDTHNPFEMPYNPDDGRESLENIGTWEDWSGTTRVVKGGNFDLFIAHARASLRYDEFFDFRFNHYGFRCVQDID